MTKIEKDILLCKQLAFPELRDKNFNLEAACRSINTILFNFKDYGEYFAQLVEIAMKSGMFSENVSFSLLQGANGIKKNRQYLVQLARDGLKSARRMLCNEYEMEFMRASSPKRKMALFKKLENNLKLGWKEAEPFFNRWELKDGFITPIPGGGLPPISKYLNYSPDEQKQYLLEMMEEEKTGTTRGLNVRLFFIFWEQMEDFVKNSLMIINKAEAGDKYSQSIVCRVYAIGLLNREPWKQDLNKLQECIDKGYYTAEFYMQIAKEQLKEKESK